MKCGLLASLAKLYEQMLPGPGGRSPQEQEETLAELAINVFLLSRRMGVSYSRLAEIMKADLRLAILNSDRNGTEDVQELLRFIETRDGKGEER